MKLLVDVVLKEIPSTAASSRLGLKEAICRQFLDFCQRRHLTAFDGSRLFRA